MTKNKVVITGGSGFVGTNLIKLLIIKTKYKIISIDGRVLKSEVLTSSKIDVSFLKKGIYFLEYENQKIKIIKN